jgi:hypothetical protein
LVCVDQREEELFIVCLCRSGWRDPLILYEGWHFNVSGLTAVTMLPTRASVVGALVLLTYCDSLDGAGSSQLFRQMGPDRGYSRKALPAQGLGRATASTTRFRLTTAKKSSQSAVKLLDTRLRPAYKMGTGAIGPNALRVNSLLVTGDWVISNGRLSRLAWFLSELTTVSDGDGRKNPDKEVSIHF